MNIWGLQQQIKQIIVIKKNYLNRPRKEINDKVMHGFADLLDEYRLDTKTGSG